MTWNALCFGLREVRAEGRTHPATAFTLHKLGYIVGPGADACGLTLTDEGRTLLDRIDRDTAQQHAELTSLAQALGRMYGAMGLRKETVH